LEERKDIFNNLNFGDESALLHIGEQEFFLTRIKTTSQEQGKVTPGNCGLE